MNDTAVPLPDPVDAEAVPDDGSLMTADQRRRVEALQVARQILENKAGLFVGSKVDTARPIWELTTLADWIIDGPDDDDDRVNVLTGSGERVASIPTRLPVGLEHVATFRPQDNNMPTAAQLIDDHDAAAAADLRAARSDADDGN